MIRGALKGKKLAVASPKEIRKALTWTGQPQTGADLIGPLQDANKALNRLLKARQKDRSQAVAKGSVTAAGTPVLAAAE